MNSAFVVAGYMSQRRRRYRARRHSNTRSVSSVVGLIIFWMLVGLLPTLPTGNVAGWPWLAHQAHERLAFEFQIDVRNQKYSAAAGGHVARHRSQRFACRVTITSANFAARAAGQTRAGPEKVDPSLDPLSVAHADSTCPPRVILARARWRRRLAASRFELNVTSETSKKRRSRRVSRTSLCRLPNSQASTLPARCCGPPTWRSASSRSFKVTA